MEDVYRLNREDLGKTEEFSGEYPEQSEYVGRYIALRFRNDADRILRERNNKYEPVKPVFYVLRWDADEENGIAILVDYKNHVVVARVAELLTHKWYEKKRWDDIAFLIPEEEKESMTEEEFNELIYKYERVYNYPSQSNKLGMAVLVEFEAEKKSILSAERYNRMTRSFSDIVDSVLASHPKKNNLTKELLRSYELYFEEHRHSLVDTPMRVLTAGVLIRCDNDFEVVMYSDRETLEEKYIINTEANFYYTSTDTERIKLEDLDLWHGLLASENLEK